MVAGVVRELGVNLGKNLGNNHEDPQFITKDLQAIRALVAARNAQLGTWGWKMPHSSEYLEELLPDLRNPFVIIVFRNLLATANSQMKRSDTTFERAFTFSRNRLAQIASIVPKLKCPLMLVDYEEATSKPDRFVQEVASFLHLPHDPDAVARAIEMINPEVGYRRLSAERWRHTVQKGESLKHATLTEVTSKRKDVGLSRVEGRLQKTGDRANFVQFGDLSGKRFWVSMRRDSDPGHVLISVDVGAGYSHNMADKVPLFLGANVVCIEAPSIRGIRIFPQFDGVWSNTKLFRIFA